VPTKSSTDAAKGTKKAAPKKRVAPARGHGRR
jgi:hypothetical protein